MLGSEHALRVAIVVTKAPARNAQVYFVGAGASGAFGIPNTQQLLDAVHGLENPYWTTTKKLADRLDRACDRCSPYRPDVGP